MIHVIVHTCPTRVFPTPLLIGLFYKILTRDLQSKKTMDPQQNDDSWTSTSAKRKRTLSDTKKALHAASVARAKPPQPKPKPKQFDSNAVTFDWVERKKQVEEYPSEELVQMVFDVVQTCFVSAAKFFSDSELKTGPSMLWHLLPGVMNSIQDTPWGYFDHVNKDATSADPLVFFINYTYGERGQDLTIGQKKFRMVILSHLKTEITASLKIIFDTPHFQVVYSKKFFDGL